MIKIFYHIYCIETTEIIVQDQINKIIFSGLYQKVETIFCFLIGETKYIESITQLLARNGKKFKIGAFGYDNPTYKTILEFNKNVVIPTHPIWLDQEANQNPYERFTLLLIKQFINPTDKILYIHSKGVTRSSNNKNQRLQISFRDTVFPVFNSVEDKNVIDWRNCMEFFLICNHEKCIQLLDEYDTVGINYNNLPLQHYSGNFWWSTAKYYNTLPDIIDYSDHINPELHIFKGNPKYKCIFNTGLHSFIPYILPCPMIKYIDNTEQSIQIKDEYSNILDICNQTHEQIFINHLEN